MKKGSFYFEHEPYRSRLLEVMLGEISNYMIRKYDYALAEQIHPDIFTFTQEDVIACQYFYDLPKDWQLYALACIEKYFEK